MFNQMPYMMAGPLSSASPSLLQGATTGAKGLGILGKIKWSSILSNAGKALNVANQAIPLYYQVKPMFNNIKALSKIGKEFTKINQTSLNNNRNNTINNSPSVNNDEKISLSENNSIPNPTFFL